MSSYRNALLFGAKELSMGGVPQERREAEHLLALVLGLSPSSLYFMLDKKLKGEEESQYKSFITRRARREPFAYIATSIPFLDCTLKVGKGVLVPRVETEILASFILKSIGKEEKKEAWDLCSGSGCLGLAIKKFRPHLNVTLADRSKKALEIAKENARCNGLEVKTLCGDLLTPFQGKKAHYIFCNPPYISEEEYLGLEKEVVEFEPKEALVAGKRGDEFFVRLREELPSFLHQGAKVFLEIGANQRKVVEKIFHQSCWKEASCIQDWAGFDRFFFLEFCR